MQVIYLQSNGLISGTLPSDLGAGLPGLRYLQFDRNRIEGALPPTLGELAHLETLDGGHNRLSSSIPETLGKLHELRLLKLNDNSLTGGIPPELGKMIRLTELDLYNNAFSGDFPSEMADLSNLRLLYVPNEQLLPVRMRYCNKRIANVGKYSWRLVREEYGRMINSLCHEPFSTLQQFSTLSEIAGDV